MLLTPLTVDEMAELLDSLQIESLRAEGVAANLVQHTGGNPMYALETLKHALSTGAIAPGRLPRPPSVGALIERRLQRLSEAALGLARVAAIAGVDFDVALAEHVLDMRALALADAWRELEAAQILRGSQFAHDLVYEAALASVPAAIAAHVHAAVAEWLEQHPHEPARVAQHWLAAGREASALKSLHAAATAARLAVRRKEEAALLERAAQIEEALGDSRAAFDTLCLLLEACVVIEYGAFDQRLPERLLALAEDDAMRTRALRLGANVKNKVGDYAAAAELARLAMESAERLSDEALVAAVRQELATALSMLGDGESAAREMLTVEPWIASHAEPGTRTAFHPELAVALDNADRHDDAQRFHRLAIDGAKAMREYDSLAVIHGNLAVRLSCSGRIDAGIEHALTSERLRAMNRETTPQSSMTPNILMQMLRDAGRYAEAMRWAELARAEYETGFARLLPLHLAQEAWLWLHLGQLRRARAALERARECEIDVAWIRGVVSHREGQLDGASGRDPRERFEAALEQFSADGRRITREAIRLDLASVIEPAAGSEIARAVLHASEVRGQAGMALAARVRCVQCLIDAGHVQDAAALARIALAGSHGVPTDTVYRGELWWQAQRALGAAGAHDEAAAAREQGVQWIKRIARDELPAAMRESFLERNPINQKLLLATRARPA